MIKYKITVNNPDLDPKTYTLLKRKYWITFFDFGWETLVETTNVEELKPYLPKIIEITRNDIKK